MSHPEHPEHPRPYHGDPRVPQAAGHGESYPAGSYELYPYIRREAERAREVTEGKPWMKCFEGFLTLETAYKAGEGVLAHSPYGEKSAQDQAKYIALAMRTTDTGCTDNVSGFFKKLLSGPYKAQRQDALRGGLYLAVELLTMTRPSTTQPIITNQLLGHIVDTTRSVSSQGSGDTCRLPFDKMTQDHKIVAELQKVRDVVDPILESLEMSAEDAALYREWVSYPDAALWKAVGESIRSLEPSVFHVESLVLLNALGACSSTEILFSPEKHMNAASDTLLEASTKRFNSTLSKATQTHTPRDVYNIAMQDAYYEILLRLSYGTEGFSKHRQLLSRQISTAIVIQTYAHLREGHPPPS
ncbi:hypothetical protein BKA59DRAFT_512747 [Fusarium tricinctum]|uniref:Uncharacterized protein n=1 Tax=Fusarium tricinctum TaxID=61284 RepID=A0A8K0W9M7_9HYPO|nr:hypothetical protein BKA59DRAFT_512747 [Fusarium tricinctum]